MIHVRLHNLGFLAIIMGIIGSTVWAPRAHAGVPDTWTTVAPLPEGRMNPAAASADRRLYVFGGGACATRFCRTFEAYDPRTNTWTAMGDMPEGLSGILSATPGPDGRIYLYGGHADRSGATMLVYDPRANTWDHEVPAPGVDGTAELVTGVDGRISAVGAGSSQGSTVLAAYDPSTHRWVAKRPFPTFQFLAGGAAGSDGRIYVVGSSVLGRRPDQVEVYDPRLAGNGLAATTGHDGRIYVLGGVSQRAANGESSGRAGVEVYDPTIHRWSKGKPMPDGRYDLAAVTGKDGRIYTLGGVSYCAPGDIVATMDRSQVRPVAWPSRPALGSCTGLKVVRAYDPRTNTWTRLASLLVGRDKPGAAVGRDGNIVDALCRETVVTWSIRTPYRVALAARAAVASVAACYLVLSNGDAPTTPAEIVLVTHDAGVSVHVSDGD